MAIGKQANRGQTMTRVAMSVRYGMSYAWTEPDDDDMTFPSIAAALAEIDQPGSQTGHPSSYYPCSKDWSEYGDERPAVAFLYPIDDNGPDLSYPLGVVTVGPRGGLRIESC